MKTAGALPPAQRQASEKRAARETGSPLAAANAMDSPGVLRV